MCVLPLGRGGNEYAPKILSVREIMLSHSFAYKIEMVMTRFITSNPAIIRINFKQQYFHHQITGTFIGEHTLVSLISYLLLAKAEVLRYILKITIIVKMLL